MFICSFSRKTPIVLRPNYRASRAGADKKKEDGSVSPILSPGLNSGTSVPGFTPQNSVEKTTSLAMPRVGDKNPKTQRVQPERSESSESGTLPTPSDRKITLAFNEAKIEQVMSRKSPRHFSSSPSPTNTEVTTPSKLGRNRSGKGEEEGTTAGEEGEDGMTKPVRVSLNQLEIPFVKDITRPDSSPMFAGFYLLIHCAVEVMHS